MNKDEIRNIMLKWHNHNSIADFCEYMCWEGLDGNKITPSGYDSLKLYDEYLFQGDFSDTWVQKWYESWTRGIDALILGSDSRLDILDWLHHI